MWSANVVLAGTGSGTGFAQFATRMFDGLTNTSCDANANNQTITWTPPTPINFNTSGELWTNGAADTNIIACNVGLDDENSLDNLQSDWTNVSPTSGTLHNIRVVGINSLLKFQQFELMVRSTWMVLTLLTAPMVSIWSSKILIILV